MTPAVRNTGPTVVFDIETVPTQAALERVMSETWDVSTFKPRNNAKDPAIIARQKEEAEAEFNASRQERADRLALDARTGRMLCYGISHDLGEPSVRVALEEGKEGAALQDAWRWIGKAGQLVTFNGQRFDLPFIVRRSIILGVAADITAGKLAPLFQRYRYTPHCDVREALGNWDPGARGTLAEWCAATGGPVPVGVGADVAQQYAAGDVLAIEQHCASDVAATAALYQRVASWFVEGAAVGAANAW